MHFQKEFVSKTRQGDKFSKEKRLEKKNSDWDLEIRLTSLSPYIYIYIYISHK